MTGSPLQQSIREAFAFGTKAQTLERLSGRLGLARLCRQCVFDTNAWRADRNSVIDRILEMFPDETIVVRSSAEGEDSEADSMAGAYESVVNVAPTPHAIAEAIERVIASYGGFSTPQEILVQKMVEDVAISGVILSRDLDTGGPYYVLNYDDFSGRTDTVTGGGESKMIQVQRSRPDALKSDRMRHLVRVMSEIEDVTGSGELDVEFCAQSDMTVYVLQVRPLAAKRKWDAPEDVQIDSALATLRDELPRIMGPVSGVAGSRTILGVMPDWNPAEMIGRTPRRLATSIYRKIITDSIWSKARAAMGYRAVDAPLMKTLIERPYIDVRLSLNSFLPASLNDELAGRIVNWQLDRLAAAPARHDKIEFGVAATCLDPSFPDYLAEMQEAGFTASDTDAFREGLADVTAAALTAGADGIAAYVAEPEKLFSDIAFQAGGSSPSGATERLDRTAQLGTFPFSILARHAFIAVSFLKGLVEQGAMSQSESSRFLMSIQTVASQFRHDTASLRAGRLEREKYLETYGHLRPGTYDIQTWRYDERPDIYLKQTAADAAPSHPPSFDLRAETGGAIDKCLADLGFRISAPELISYMSAAIAARERAKFAFTRGVSDSLKELCDWGAETGNSRQDLANTKLSDLIEAEDHPSKLSEYAAAGRAAHRLSQSTLLHHLITSPEEIDIVYPARGEPTYIGNDTVIAPVATLTRNETPDLDGAIVLIESADPGYDWIFTHAIAGLVTQYGGANSHMAIRCAEFSLPAAIGCGERVFENLKQAAMLELDCSARRLSAH